MRLFFKLRDPKQMNADEQQAFIEKNIEMCRFDRYGVKLDEYLTHIAKESQTKDQEFTVASFKVNKTADFTKIERTMKLYNLQHTFVIFVLL